jgi:hypothetical protein
MNKHTQLYTYECWGVRKSDGIPEHKILEPTHESRNKRGDEESPKVCFRLKSCEAPFYKETKGFLHSMTTLESREYSWCEHVHERLLHPVICGANFTYLPAGHQFTP